ncbi:phosphoribosylanthranilate isomerase [Herminiimonas fonticola]|uniref:N-(5'-phosphoribosyl)anthranilate isomerase n=1 Tax=Herminiimonas fonticola TaxID=303380 RepID=A0A4R6G6F4_9BURK|nr:phosphoribosylanthranilate isomerase [Herminiimonas fonticola]RBA24077.1 Phosphoribosylanthranilate isomerase [Herminiimonas fonticola]TDN90076.1 phosphoribosylanthranilate isomerase [Herminiimonas fonticola]
MTHRTRIKICGLTRLEDVQGAITAGADAVGFVFYAKSPRYIQPETAAKLIAQIPPFVTAVGLFVNASVEEVQVVVEQTSIAMLQFHGDETVEQCAAIAAAVNRPFMRAIRVKPDTSPADLLKYESDYRAASRLFTGLLLDTYVDSYGGSGKVFDWSLIPENIAPRVVLSGGLSVQNATDAVTRVRPYAVDISSGVERDKGIKDLAKIRAFIAAVQLADTANANARSQTK